MTDVDPTAFFEQVNEQMLRGVERNLEAQERFLDAWRDAIVEATDDEFLESGAEGLTNAYGVWLNASQQMAEEATNFAEGEGVDAATVRDIWLRAANDSFKEVMQTAAFAEVTGESVAGTLDLQRQADEAMQDWLEGVGMATADHVEEVGDRLVELERRQHEVEQRLDEILDRLEEQ